MDAERLSEIRLRDRLAVDQMPRERDNPALAEMMRRDWDARAQADSFHYIYSDVSFASAEEFFSSGEADYLRYVEPVVAKLEIQTEGRAILELGCGVGRMTRSFARRFSTVYALDISPEMLRQGRALHPDFANIVWMQGDGQGLGMFADARLDFVFSFIVLQHMPTAELGLNYVREMLRVLKPGGAFCFQFNNRQAPTMNWRGRMVWRMLDRLREPLLGLNLQGLAKKLSLALGLNPLYAGRTWHGAVLDGDGLLEAVRQSSGTIHGSSGWGTQAAWCHGRKNA
jgi:ubiquinone/menaquinone biosynthesis C-methylase UbiE